MNPTVKLKTFAKVNLFLDIAGVYDNDYHELSSIFQSVELYDEVAVSLRNDRAITVSVSGISAPIGVDNIAFKVAEKLLQRLDNHSGVHIHIEKNIPTEAGLGGGSANGAGVLVGLNELLGKRLTTGELMEIGGEIGADIPFCIVGGSCLVGGIGEKISPLPKLWTEDTVFLIVKPPEGISTKAAFAAYDATAKSELPKSDIDGLLTHWQQGNMAEVAHRFYNVFQHVLGLIETEKLKAVMTQNGALGAVLSGSGSSVVSVFQDESLAKSCKELLSRNYEQVFVVTAKNVGVETIY